MEIQGPYEGFYPLSSNAFKFCGILSYSPNFVKQKHKLTIKMTRPTEWFEKNADLKINRVLELFTLEFCTFLKI